MKLDRPPQWIINTAKLALLASAWIAWVLAAETRADDYPSRSITIVTSVPAGGSVDALARVTADKLREKWGQPAVVENRPGASGNIGIGAVERSAPDGYTFLFNPGAHLVINKILFPTASSDPDNLEPVSRIATNPVVLAVNPKVPANSLEEFVKYAKENPGKLNYASAGNGGMPHLAAEMFQMKAKVKMTKVTFRGVAPAMVGLVAGQVDLIFVDISTALPHIQSGRLKVFGVASEKRHPVLPNTPALGQVYPGLTAETWFALSAPPKTPADIINKVSLAVAEGYRQPDVQQRLKNMGNIEAVGSTPAEMAAFIKQERERWGAVIHSLGLTGK
jgi:tripartite-type tricarboxylate transporter receptor subunit TctC